MLHYVTFQLSDCLVHGGIWCGQGETTHYAQLQPRRHDRSFRSCQDRCWQSYKSDDPSTQTKGVTHMWQVLYILKRNLNHKDCKRLLFRLVFLQMRPLWETLILFKMYIRYFYFCIVLKNGPSLYTSTGFLCTLLYLLSVIITSLQHGARSFFKSWKLLN